MRLENLWYKNFSKNNMTKKDFEAKTFLIGIFW